jgi:hypothetical protein
MHPTYLAHFIFLYLIIPLIFVEEYKLRSSSLCSFPHTPATSLILSSNILQSTLFSDTLNVRDQLLHPYQSTGKIMVVSFNLYVIW